MDLFERYVQEFGRSMPKGMRMDAERDLRSLLRESLDTRSAESDRETGELKLEILTEYGPPDVVARSYAPRPQWLIGPRYLPGYWMALRVCALVALAGWIQAIVGFADWSGGLSTLLPSAGAWLGEILTGFCAIAGFLALLFAVLERTLDDPGASAAAWDPTTLPPAIGPQHADRRVAAVRVALAVCALALLNLSPGLIGGGFVTIGDEKGWVPLAGQGIRAALPWLDAALLIDLFVGLAQLRRGRWSALLRMLDLCAKFLWVAVLYRLATGGQLHVDASWLTSHGWSPEAARGYVEHVDDVLRGQMSMVMMGATAVMAVLTTLRIYQHGRGFRS